MTNHILTIDLDNTLLLFLNDGTPKICDNIVKTIQFANNLQIPCCIVTSRHINDVIKHLITDLYKIKKQNFDDERQTKHLKEVINSYSRSSFRAVIGKLRSLNIIPPQICTTLDPLLPIGQQGGYHESVDRFTDYCVSQLHSVIKQEKTLSDLIDELRKMREIIGKKGDQEAKSADGNKIYSLVTAERDLYAKLDLESMKEGMKHHQFHYLKGIFNCEFIIHIDDFDAIWKSLGLQSQKDNPRFYAQKISHGESSVSVCCLPFTPYTRPHIVAKVTRGFVSYSIQEALNKIKEFEKGHQKPCWPFFCCSLSTLNESQEQIIIRTKNLLVNISYGKHIVPDEIKSSALEAPITSQDDRILPSSEENIMPLHQPLLAEEDEGLQEILRGIPFKLLQTFRSAKDFKPLLDLQNSLKLELQSEQKYESKLRLSIGSC